MISRDRDSVNLPGSGSARASLEPLRAHRKQPWVAQGLIVFLGLQRTSDKSKPG